MHKDPEQLGLKDLQRGAKEFQEGLNDESEKLRDLFVSLKTDLLDQLLQPGNHHLAEGQLRILDEQVRHVVSVARACGFKELQERFGDEKKILGEIKDLVHQYPNIDIETSPDLKSALERLRSLLHQQQSLIFDHEHVLQQEKQRLVDILQQVDALKLEYKQDHSLRPQEITLTQQSYA